jgi:hypothetical protein
VGREHLRSLDSGTARLTIDSLKTVIRKLKEVCPGVNVKLPKEQAATSPTAPRQSGTSRQSQARIPPGKSSVMYLQVLLLMSGRAYC